MEAYSRQKSRDTWDKLTPPEPVFKQGFDAHDGKPFVDLQFDVSGSYVAGRWASVEMTLTDLLPIAVKLAGSRGELIKLLVDQMEGETK